MVQKSRSQLFLEFVEVTGAPWRQELEFPDTKVALRENISDAKELTIIINSTTSIFQLILKGFIKTTIARTVS